LKVPFFDLAPTHEPLEEEIINKLRAVIRSNRYILGPEVSALEEEFAQYCGSENAVGVSSGTDALLAAMMAAGIGPGRSVITTPFTFFATAGCISRLGATPVFADIDPETFGLDPASVEAAFDYIKKRGLPDACGVVIVHLYGHCADIEAIAATAAKHGAAVIEDAAQAVGSTLGGRHAGTWGLYGCFSFFPTKNLGALGDGGMVLASNENAAEDVRIMRAHGSKPKYYHRRIGGNFRLDALQAAVLRIKLGHLDEWTDTRRKNAEFYRELFSTMDPDGLVTLPSAKQDAYHTYHQYVVRVPDRDEVKKTLAHKDVGTEVYYPLPLHMQPCFSDLGYGEGQFPEAEKAVREVLALPVFPGITQDQQETVVSELISALRKRAQ